MSGPPDVVVDARGLRCPMPVLELARRVVGLPPGTLVALLSDDPAAAADVPAWCSMRGQEYLGQGEDPEGGGASYLVRLPKAGGDATPSARPSSAR